MTRGSHRRGGWCRCVEAETERKPQAQRATACFPRRFGFVVTYPARLPGSFAEPDSQSQKRIRECPPRWGCCLQGGGREAGSTGSHFPGSFSLSRDWLAVPSRLCAEVRLPTPSSFPRAASASFLCLHPQPLSPSAWSWAPSPQSARALDVGAGQVHGSSTQDGQPLHQHCGHRGLEPAECGHPGHAGGGVGVLQVRTQPFPSLFLLPNLPGWLRLESARDNLRLCAGEKLRDDWEIYPLWVWSHPRFEWLKGDSGNWKRAVGYGTETFCFLSGKRCKSWLGCDSAAGTPAAAHFTNPFYVPNPSCTAG